MKDYYRAGVAVTPSDSAAGVYDALYVGGTGAVAVVTAGGGDVIFSAVPAGTLLPVAVTKVLATGTTATLIVGLR